MKVHEVIAELQNYPMDAEVFCLSEDSDWQFNGENSVEVVTCEEWMVQSVEKFHHYMFDDQICIKIC